MVKRRIEWFEAKATLECVIYDKDIEVGEHYCLNDTGEPREDFGVKATLYTLLECSGTRSCNHTFHKTRELSSIKKLAVPIADFGISLFVIELLGSSGY